MGFWIFMLCVDLLVPITMIGLGYCFIKKPPKDINSIVGYRTKRSMKNQQAWDFAHKYFGKLWCKTGAVLVILSLIMAILLIGKSKNVVGTVMAIFVDVQCVIMIIPIIPTERILKKNFE